MYADYIAHFYNVIYIVGFLIKNILWLRIVMILGALFESYYFILIGGDELMVNLAWCSVWIIVNLVQMFFLLKDGKRKINLQTVFQYLIIAKF